MSRDESFVSCFKIRTNKDGSKTQVVRQYGCNTTSANGEPNENVSYQQNSFVYINGMFGQKFSCIHTLLHFAQNILATSPTKAGDDISINSAPAHIPTSSCSVGHSATGSLRNGAPGVGSLVGGGGAGGGGISGGGSGGGTASSGGGGAGGSGSNYRGHIVRLNSIEPNTVMFSTKDYPILSDVTVPEIIDELEKQFEDKLCDLQGVRLVSGNVYICLSRKESVQHLTTYGFYMRGVPVKVVDITNESVVVCLSGVPHYITDATITMLVSTFGISIGEVERRFYKGVDTGERFIRLKPRAHTQVFILLKHINFILHNYYLVFSRFLTL